MGIDNTGDSEQLMTYYKYRERDIKDGLNILAIRTEALEARKAEHLNEIKHIDDDLEDVDRTVSKLFVEYQTVLDALSRGGTE